MKWEYIDNDTIRIRANSSGGNYSVTGDFSLLGDAAQRPILLNHGSKTTACGSFITWDELTAAGWSVSKTELCRFYSESLTRQNIEKPRLPLWKQTGFCGQGLFIRPSVHYMNSGAKIAIRATIVAHWMTVTAVDMYLGTVFIVSSSKWIII